MICRGWITIFIVLKFVSFYVFGCLLFFGLLSYLVYNKFCRLSNNSIVIKSKFAKFFFESKILSISVAPFSVFLFSVFIKFGIVAFLLISSLFMVILLIISSQWFLNILFDLEQCFIELNELINSYLSKILQRNVITKSLGGIQVHSIKSKIRMNNSLFIRKYSTTSNVKDQACPPTSSSNLTEKVGHLLAPLKWSINRIL